MKKVVVFAVTVSLCSCFGEKEIQVNLVDAQLVKIDTIYRYSGNQQVLVWKCSNNIEYVSYASMGKTYQVGSKMLMMVQR